MTDSGYAVRSDFSSWRRCLSTDTLTPDEIFYTQLPQEAIQAELVRRSQLEEKQVLLNIDKATLFSEYQQTIDQLTSIENAVSPTNAQVIAAVKYLAKTLRLLLKIIARLVT